MILLQKVVCKNQKLQSDFGGQSLDYLVITTHKSGQNWKNKWHKIGPPREDERPWLFTDSDQKVDQKVVISENHKNSQKISQKFSDDKKYILET